MMVRGARELVLIVGSMLALCGMPLEATASGAQFSCRDRVLVDYGEALKGMPSDHLPGQGGLPAGPADLGLKAGRSVTVEGEPISFGLVLDRPVGGDGRVERPANLDWTIALALHPVNQLGHPSGAPERRRWRVKQLRHPERRFDIRADPGLYRVSIAIRKIGGQVFANYRQFIRVLPVRDKIGIRIRGVVSAYHPGDTVVARVENRGTREALFPDGSGLVTERLEAGQWMRAEPDGEAPSVMFEDPEFLQAGRASGCSYFTIPTNPVSTSFRFSVVAQIGPGSPRKVVRTFAVGG
jgi:hypothetical protein